MTVDLTTLTDQEIADQIRALTAEQGRRIFLARAEWEHSDIVARYEEAVAREAAAAIGDVPPTGAVGPGGRIIDTEGVEWINQSGAWLSPHVAGPDVYPMGWRLANPPDPDVVAPWAAGETVTAGDLRSYEGVTYKCITGHTTQAGWTPPVVPALWSVA